MMSVNFGKEIVDQLNAKLDQSAVKERTQAGRKLSYVEGWHVIAEANRIFGFGAWQRETLEIRCVAEGPRKIGRPPNERDGFGVSYVAKVRVTVENLIREGVGSGHGIDADLGLAHESAVKEAETDAMKRAFMTFGNPFGLALYDKTQANVDHDVGPPATGRTQDAARPTAAHQKRELEEIDRELLDCGSVVAVNKCAEAWKHIASRDGWSKDYREAAAKKFQARRETLNAADVFPGDLPSNLANSHQRPLEARP